jgi:hypothetical protein
LACGGPFHSATDAGASDASPPGADASVVDSGPSDAGVFDSGPISDAGPADANSVQDSGPVADAGAGCYDGGPLGAGRAPPVGKRWVRIRALDATGWSLTGVGVNGTQSYTAQDILTMIRELQPDVLERYTTGAMSPDMLVPTSPDAGLDGGMTVLQFLQASLDACQLHDGGCYMIPRVTLDEYDAGTIYRTTRELFGLPLTPPLRYLSLDNWTPFYGGHSECEIRNLFEALYGEGWQGLAVIWSQPASPLIDDLTFGEVTSALAKDAGNWKAFHPDFGTIKLVQSNGLGQVLNYIDFPTQIQTFIDLLDVNQEAMALENNYAPAQADGGFFFVYPIIQGPWDAPHRMTSADGGFAGESLYEVMKQLMQTYN